VRDGSMVGKLRDGPPKERRRPEGIMCGSRCGAPEILMVLSLPSECESTYCPGSISGDVRSGGAPAQCLRELNLCKQPGSQSEKEAPCPLLQEC
jgi:hypothetical protein